MKIDIFHHTVPAKLPILYGVWLPGEGWLKAAKPNGTVSACAFEIRKEAQSLARLLGGRVQYIDDSIASNSVESKLKGAEIIARSKDKKCPIWMNWLGNRKK